MFFDGRRLLGQDLTSQFGICHRLRRGLAILAASSSVELLDRLTIKLSHRHLSDAYKPILSPAGADNTSRLVLNRQEVPHLGMVVERLLSVDGADSSYSLLVHRDVARVSVGKARAQVVLIAMVAYLSGQVLVLLDLSRFSEVFWSHSWDWSHFSEVQVRIAKPGVLSFGIPHEMLVSFVIFPLVVEFDLWLLNLLDGSSLLKHLESSSSIVKLLEKGIRSKTTLAPDFDLGLSTASTSNGVELSLGLDDVLSVEEGFLDHVLTSVCGETVYFKSQHLSLLLLQSSGNAWWFDSRLRGLLDGFPRSPLEQIFVGIGGLSPGLLVGLILQDTAASLAVGVHFGQVNLDFGVINRPRLVLHLVRLVVPLPVPLHGSRVVSTKRVKEGVFIGLSGRAHRLAASRVPILSICIQVLLLKHGGEVPGWLRLAFFEFLSKFDALLLFLNGLG